MKSNIIKFITVVAVLFSVSAFGQSNTKVLVPVFSAAPPAAFNTLSNGKFQGFSKEDKAFVIIPNDDKASTLAKLEKELKAIVPSGTVISRKKD